MAASQDSLQMAVVAQPAIETTPTTPAFDLMRVTSDDLAYNAETERSAELGGGRRGHADNILLNANVTGSVSFELAKSVALEALLSGVFMNSWSMDELTVGNTISRWFIEKRFTMDDGSFLFHQFRGCVMNGLNLSITPGSTITGSIDVLGETMLTDTNPIAGATYAAAGQDPIMTAPAVTDVTLKEYPGGATIFEVGTHCWTNIDLALTNSARAINCIGKLGAKDHALGKFEGTVSFSIFLTSNVLFEKLVSQDEMEMTLTVADANGENYTLTFPRIKLASATAPTTGSDDDLVVTGEFAILHDDTNGWPAKVDRSSAATATVAGTTTTQEAA